MRGMIGAALAVLLATACSPSQALQGTGSNGQRSFDVGAFSSVELAGPYDVIVTVGGAPSVRAEGDEAALEQLDIRLEDGRLWIGNRSGTWGTSGRAIVHVTTPSLESANLGGSGDLRVGALRAAQFRGAVAGSGNLVLQALDGESATFEVAGSGDVRVAGRVGRSTLNIAGSGSADLSGLESESADISIAGSGDADVRASGTAAVAIIGSGNARVTGGAACTINKAGSGNVRCG